MSTRITTTLAALTAGAAAALLVASPAAANPPRVPRPSDGTVTCAEYRSLPTGITRHDAQWEVMDAFGVRVFISGEGVLVKAYRAADGGTVYLRFLLTDRWHLIGRSWEKGSDR